MQQWIAPPPTPPQRRSAAAEPRGDADRYIETMKIHAGAFITAEPFLGAREACGVQRR